MKEKPQETADAATSFEEALDRLERIVGDLEDGPLGLAEALARYEEGIRCLKHCYGTLEQAERRIEMLAGVDAQGQPIVEALEDESSLSLEEKAAARSRRRSRTSKSSGAKAQAESGADAGSDASGDEGASDESSGGGKPGRGSIDRGKSLF